MDRGRRPASRFDELDFPEEFYGRDFEKGGSYDTEKHQSGLSDMLAAFPPPASRRSMRPSGTWPLPLSRQSFRGEPMETQQPVEQRKKSRRCCGLPLWAFLFLLLVILCIIAAAIVVPLEIFVIRKPNNNTAPAEADSGCPAQLTCQNGGTKVISQDVCSCICSNGFTGTDCTIATSQGCTTTTISTGGTSINNVTIGQAIPRLIENAQANFSIPLSATAIQSRFNSGNLSCNSENALVTFDGESSRTDDSQSDVTSIRADAALVRAGEADATTDAAITLTVVPGIDATIIISEPTGTNGVMITTLTAPTTLSGVSTIFATTLTLSMPVETASTTKATTTQSPAASITSGSTSAMVEPTGTFTVSEDAVDFARVAVLYVFQKESLEDATTAQTALQEFFTSADSSSSVTMKQAMNVTIGGSRTVDVVNFFIDIGDGKVVGGTGS
ncbi:Uu.00g110890.m01.CDS01 [Anthostomella pinea]|uniref:Uu.00g110890.m01.CDS01 n=1 Tax=Anthostomella pinea TaxID=933095 RepID=A0AAI8VFH6_9PEZI|nr:Uu.00g110890.m01.CDS01 [Anthostomella pinea]